MPIERNDQPQRRVAVFCPHCRHGYRVAARLLNRRMICRHCRKGFRARELDSEGLRRLQSGSGGVEPASDSPRSGSSLDKLPSAGRRSAAIDTRLAGQMLGRYKVLSILGQGGMGVVWRGHDDKLKRDAALKIMTRSGKHNESIGGVSVELFMQEARAVAKLQHPAVVSIYEVAEDQGQVFLALELMEGGTLKEYVEQNGPIPPKQLFAWLVGPAKALALAHERGIIHRDIKPGNLMFDEHGHLKLMDFGLADVAYEEASERVRGKAVGSLGWIAPETARGKGNTAASDIFGMGLVMMYALRGKPWLHEKSRSKLIALHRNPPEPDFDSIEGLTANAEQMIRRCLATEPSERFASAQELTRALEACAAEDPHERKRRRINSASIAASAAILGGLAVGSGVLYYFLDLFEKQAIVAQPAAQRYEAPMRYDDSEAPPGRPAPGESNDATASGKGNPTFPPPTGPVARAEPAAPAPDGAAGPFADLKEAKVPWPEVPELVDPTKLHWIGTRNGRVYHLPTTECGRSIYASNLVTFDTVEEAEAGGRTFCRRCQREQHDSQVAKTQDAP